MGFLRFLLPATLLLNSVALKTTEITSSSSSTLTPSPNHANDDNYIFDDDEGKDGLECGDIIKQNASNQCAFARKYCESDHFDMSFEISYFCGDSSSRVPQLFLIFFALLYLVNLLGTTADNYFVIQLEHLAAVMNLPDDVAGVTLLAFGNGAPDIFTAIGSVSSDDPDFSLALADLLGGGMFINTVILGAVILCSTVEVDKRPFRRDFLMYFGTNITIVVIAFFEKINLWEAIFFLVAYVAYVLYVIFGSSQAPIEEEPENNYLRASSIARDVAVHRDLAALPFIRNSKSVDNFLHHSGGLNKFKSSINDLKSLSNMASSGGDAGYGHEGVINDGFSFHKLHDHDHEHDHGHDHDHDHDHGHDHEHGRTDRLSRISNLSKNDQLFPIIGLTDQPNFQDDSAISVVVWHLEWPLSLIRHLSIPPSDEAWDFKRRVLASVTPIFGLQIMILAAFGLDGFRGDKSFISSGAIIVGAVLCVFILLTSDNVNKPVYFNVLVCFGFCMSIAWLDIIANEVVAILQFVGILLSIPTSFMGLTVLAWGNSVGDFVADTATARAGAVKSALAAIFGSPLLASLVGLGLSLTLSISKDGPLVSEIDGQNVIAVGFLFATLVSTFVVFERNNYKPPRWFAYYLFVLYAGFMAASCLLEVSGIDISMKR